MRPSCLHCLRPKTTCICHLISKIHSDIEVLILQHPQEVNETKGTARLLHLCLPNSRILINEIFDEAVFMASKLSLLLYPVTPEDHSLGIAAPPELNPALLKNLSNIRLIIIDGTWRKSRKILIKNPHLQTLPRLILNDLPTGQYTIRKARKPDQLSTLEATCTALAQLETDTQKFAPIIQAFNEFNLFIGKQMKFV
jgi:DTW domain-containing protein YfiP